MATNLLTFKRLTQEDQVNDIVELLKKHNIVYEVEKFMPTYNAAIGGIVSEKEFILKIASIDFTTVENLLQEEARGSINQIDKSYYLFEFSDEELFDILLKLDEWSPLDFELAKKLLSERGKSITPEVLDLMRSRRIEELAKPEPSSKTWIFAGYLFALLGGILGILIGWHLMSHKKTLPNGTRIYGHNKSDRKHGQIIFIVGCILFAIGFSLRAYLSVTTGSDF